MKRIPFLVSTNALFPILSTTFLLLSGVNNALCMTPGEEFLSAFGVSPTLLETTNCVENIANIAGKTFCTNAWSIEFSELQFEESAQRIPFVAVLATNQTTIVGTVERHMTPEDAFWSAATHICTNSLPMYVHSRDWSASTNASGILFSHRHPSSAFDDKRIAISRNILLVGETKSNTSDFEFPFRTIFRMVFAQPLKPDDGI